MKEISKIMHPEVLIYIQSVKNFFKKNEETKNYFLGRTSEDEFFKKVEQLSVENFLKNNEPMLTQEQFELLRKVTEIESVTKELNQTKDSLLNFQLPNQNITMLITATPNIYFDMENYPRVYLN